MYPDTSPDIDEFDVLTELSAAQILADNLCTQQLNDMVEYSPELTLIRESTTITASKPAKPVMLVRVTVTHDTKVKEIHAKVLGRTERDEQLLERSTFGDRVVPPKTIGDDYDEHVFENDNLEQFNLPQFHHRYPAEEIEIGGMLEWLVEMGYIAADYLDFPDPRLVLVAPRDLERQYAQPGLCSLLPATGNEYEEAIQALKRYLSEDQERKEVSKSEVKQ
jgi:hypothetical protein